MDYFTLFNLPIAIPVDKTELNARYQQLQKTYHPDNFAQAASNEQRQALQQSALINDAYRQLKHPLRSIEYFLSLQGIDIHQIHTIDDTEFLMAQLDLREALDGIMQVDDESVRETRFNAFSAKVNEQFKTHYQVLLDLLQTAQWQQAAESVIRLQFFEKLQQQIDAFEEQQY